jgi:WD40 repeat protein
MVDTTTSAVKQQASGCWLKHEDYVHDVQFDYYGKRIATCSSDQLVKIWEKNSALLSAGISAESLGVTEENAAIAVNQWTCTASIGGKHNGPVWRVAWADPEFGSIVASSGND